MLPRALSAILVSSSLLVGASAHASEKQLHRVDLGTPVKRTVSELNTRAARAIIRGDYQKALTISEVAITTDPSEAWPHYDRAVALAHLGAITEATREFQAAQARFRPDDRWGRSVAIYGRAHALAEDGRCQLAEQAFAEYALYVGKDDPQAAEMALTYAADCRLPEAPQVSTRQTRIEQEQLALATAEGKEAYARSVEQWASRAQASLIVDADAKVKLEKIRGRALLLETRAKQDERTARAALRADSASIRSEAK